MNWPLGSRWERRRRIVHSLLFAWSLLVFVFFIRLSSVFPGMLPASVVTLVLGLATAYAFWFMGYRIGRHFFPDFIDALGPTEACLVEFGAGTALTIALMIVAGAAGLYWPSLAVGGMVLALVGPHRSFILDIRARYQTLGGGVFSRFMAALVLIVAGITLIENLTPVTSQDALVYHLAIPAKYVEAHAIVSVPGNFFAQFPQNIEMLFTLGLLLEGPALAQWYHWMFGVAAAIAVGQLAVKVHRRASPLLATAIFATVPTVALIAGWAYIDLGVLFFILLSTICLLRWYDQEEFLSLLLAALFAGAAAGSKYTAGFQGILVVAAVLLRKGPERQGYRRRVLEALAAAGVVCLVACPWWIKNLVFTGNPVYPFLYGTFGGKDWDPERATVLSMALAEWGGKQGLLDILLLPWRLTVSGEFFSQANFDGVIGCLFLMGLPFAVWGLGLSRGYKVLAIFTVAYGGFWVLTTRQVRFLLPALAFSSALMGASVPALLGTLWTNSWTCRVLKAAAACNVFLMFLHFAFHNPLPVVMGLERPEQFLRRELPGGDYGVFEYIDTALPKESYILFGSLGNPGFLCKRRYYSDAFFENWTLRDILGKAADADAAYRGLAAKGFTHLLFRWELVFDPRGQKSDIPLDDQLKLMQLLNRHALLLIDEGGTRLYALGWEMGPEGYLLR